MRNFPVKKASQVALCERPIGIQRYRHSTYRVLVTISTPVLLAVMQPAISSPPGSSERQPRPVTPARQGRSGDSSSCPPRRCRCWLRWQPPHVLSTHEALATARCSMPRVNARTHAPCGLSKPRRTLPAIGRLFESFGILTSTPSSHDRITELLARPRRRGHRGFTPPSRASSWQDGGRGRNYRADGI
jgi:hypothetical protein